MAKKKIGEIYNKPIVIGDKNLMNGNEIHVDDLKATDVSRNSTVLLCNGSGYVIADMLEKRNYSNFYMEFNGALDSYIEYSTINTSSNGFSLKHVRFLEDGSMDILDTEFSDTSNNTCILFVEELGGIVGVHFTSNTYDPYNPY